MNSGSVKSEFFLRKSLVLQSESEAITQVEVLLDEISTELSFREDVYGNIMVAVTEAVNNSILHGNKSDSSKKEYLDCEMSNPYSLLVRVRDEGDGFKPDKLDDPTSPENIDKIGGRGVFLMEQLADELEFNEEGTQVEMRFNV